MPYVFKKQMIREIIPVSLDLDQLTATGYVFGSSSTGINLGPVGGIIESIQGIYTKAGAGASAAVTFHARLNGTATTGGVVTLAVDSSTLGTVVDGTAITGNNVFSANATLQLHTTVTTAFTAGKLEVFIRVKRYLATG